MIKIEHLAVWVRDLEASRRFYETYFGAQAGALYHNPTKGFTSYFLSFDTGPRLELMHRNDIPDGDQYERMGITHFAVAVGSKTAVDSLTEKLRNDGYEVVGEPRTTGDGYYEGVVLDGEGNRIEITV